MVLRRYYGLLYGVLVVLIVALGAWWVIFLTQEGRNYERYQLQRMATDRIHAEYLIRTVPEVQSDPTGQLGECSLGKASFSCYCSRPARPS